MDRMANFASNKRSVLAKADLSRKGSVDEPIRDLIHFINSQECFYTTSSCSGRLAVFSENNEQRKKGCRWLLMSHDQINLSQLVSSLTLTEDGKDGEDCKDGARVSSSCCYSFFKFEAFILHAMSRCLSDAQEMLQVAVKSGFRNSGISCGRKGKIMLAVRSTHSLEVPLMYEGKLLVNETYLEHLVKLGNSKLMENRERTDSFYFNLKSFLELRSKDTSPNTTKSLQKHNRSHVPHPSPPSLAKILKEGEGEEEEEEEIDLSLGLLELA